MSIKDQIMHELDSLSGAELQQVAQYLAFVKYQARIKIKPVLDENQLALLYAEFSEDDIDLAEAGMSDYADALAQEDVR